jgi:hypothetical protein
MTTKKANPDYSASAVNLTNPPEVQELLMAQLNRQAALVVLKDQADACIPDALKREIGELEAAITIENTSIKGYIDTFGSYQNVDTGMYGVKQRRESITYKPELVRQYAPSKVASFVLVESVDQKAMDAMLKTGQLSPEQAKQCGEVKESFAYIIR